MALRTITSPGVTINEIDKSGYTPVMTGTAVYLHGFSAKGEPYKPFEVTTRSAFEQIFGVPDTEAERYFYAGACETLNQNGRLYCARLPYDNESFDKVVGVKYTVEKQDKVFDGILSSMKLVKDADEELEDAYVITGSKTPAVYDLSAIQAFRTDEARVPKDSFLIVDTTLGTYNRVIEDSRMGEKREVIGIVPVVTTLPNALYAQSYITPELSDIHNYEALSGSRLLTLKTDSGLSNDGLSSSDVVVPFNTDGMFKIISSETRTSSIAMTGLSSSTAEAALEEFKALSSTFEAEILSGVSGYINGTVSATFAVDGVSAEVSGDTKWTWNFAYKYDVEVTPFYESTAVGPTQSIAAASFFPPIQPAVDGNGLDPEHLKDICIVVFKMYLDPAEGNKVSYEPVEAFAGSLCKDDKDPNTGVSKFIDDIVNSNSKYINFFSNCFATPTDKAWYNDTCDLIALKPSAGSSLGFYSSMTAKDISISRSILEGMEKAFAKVSDVNLLDIDIVPDAGVSNIASYLNAIFGDKGPYDLSITDSLGNSLLGSWKAEKAKDDCVKAWKNVILKHDNFCKNVRKDCMFVADGLRPLVLQGQKKKVRDTKPDSSIDKDIIPYIPAICGINTNYGAGYCDWFQQADDYTGDFFWCPPSIKATGIYINTDVNFDYWLAPAGLNRGIVAALDVAFSPTAKQASAFYDKNWNYAVDYPQDGIVLEGQKTFQTKPSALDRVNVRRTMLRLERQVYKTIRYFVYESNTAYTRQRVVDAIDPILRACWKSGNGGLSRYKIVCDESNNDANTIDNNELKVQIALVPTKSAEFVIVDFILGSQGSTWAELLG